MAADELGVLRGDEPIDAGARVAAAEFFEDGQGVDHVADGGGLDEEDAREIHAADVESWQGEIGTVAGEGAAGKRWWGYADKIERVLKKFPELLFR